MEEPSDRSPPAPAEPPGSAPPGWGSGGAWGEDPEPGDADLVQRLLHEAAEDLERDRRAQRYLPFYLLTGLVVAALVVAVRYGWL